MPIIQCPNCKFKMLSANPTCPNCGAALSGSSTPSKAPLPLPAPTRWSGPVPPAPMGSSGPVPPPAPASTPLPPLPAPSSSVSVYGPLPSSMPSRSPDLEGKIAFPPTVTQVKLADGDWSSCLLKLVVLPLLVFFRFFDLMLGLFAGQHRRVERTMTVHIARVRRPDGTTREVRFEGDLVGAGLNLGDRISLWGSDRTGTLVITKGYNHDAGGDIRLRRPNAPWGTRIAAIIVLIFLLYFALLLCTPHYYR